ncbi:hypothetical protein KI387_015817, partial [Taxus chinensis]
MEIVGFLGSKIWKEQVHRTVIVLAGVTAIYALVLAWNNGYSPSIWFSLHSAEIGHDPISPHSNYSSHISISPSLAPQGLVTENDSVVSHALPPYSRNNSTVSHASAPQGMVKVDAGKNNSEGLNAVNSSGVQNGSTSGIGDFDVSNDDNLSNNSSVAHQNNVSASGDINSARQGFHNITEENNSVSGSNAVEEWVEALAQQLAFAKNGIDNAPPVLVNDPDLYGPLYHNLSRFKRSYEMMEKIFKVYVYAYGEKPYFHKGPMEAIYASEGWFMKQMEENQQFVTKDYREAHMYYIPYSVFEMRIGIPAPNHQNMPQITTYIKGQINMLASKYPFWNRTHGRDHFFVACHDW